MADVTRRDVVFYSWVAVCGLSLGAYVAMVMHLGYLAAKGPVMGVAAAFFAPPLALLFFLVTCLAFEQRRWIAGSVLLLVATIAGLAVFFGWVAELGGRLA